MNLVGNLSALLANKIKLYVSQNVLNSPTAV